MNIQKLRLRNYRCFIDREFLFHNRLTLIVGENASGKTSLLEALSVALGGWLYGFDGLDTKDKRNITKSDCRAMSATVNDALLLQVPVEIECRACFPDGELVTWKRELLHLNGRTTTGGLQDIRKRAENYNQKIHSGNDGDLMLPLVAYYSAARLWNEPIQWERSAKRDAVRISGYKKSISFSNSVKDAMNFIDRMAYMAYREEDADAQGKMEAILHVLTLCLQSIMPNVHVEYSMKAAEFQMKTPAGEIKPYSLLSDGYRCAISLFMDIARRVFALNPHAGASALQKTSGVVLIDEIDLHLHPRWQQKILDDLQALFPQLQFIVTTHAPSVIQSVKKENLMVLSETDTYYYGQNVYGRDANSILIDVMGVNVRPDAVDKRFKDVYKHIDAGQWQAAVEQAAEIEQIIGDNDSELTGIKVTIALESLEE